jgi:hypothetical protein
LPKVLHGDRVAGDGGRERGHQGSDRPRFVYSLDLLTIVPPLYPVARIIYSMPYFFHFIRWSFGGLDLGACVRLQELRQARSQTGMKTTRPYTVLYYPRAADSRMFFFVNFYSRRRDP